MKEGTYRNIIKNGLKCRIQEVVMILIYEIKESGWFPQLLKRKKMKMEMESESRVTFD